MIFVPHPYQDKTLDWLLMQTLEHGHRGGMLFLEPGLGKTVVTLTWFQCLRRAGLARRMLVVAPVRVRDNVWPSEPQQWDHLTDRVVVLGSGKWPDPQGATVAVVNPESLSGVKEWMQKYNFNADTLVVDESGDFRTWTSTRSKLLRKMIPNFLWRLCLTATPVPESAADIFPQTWFIDQGERLGKNITQFRNRFCYRGGYESRTWFLKETATNEVANLVAPLSLHGRVLDNLRMPPIRSKIHIVKLDPQSRKLYNTLANKEKLVLPGLAAPLIPKNAGSKRLLLRQICAGSVYDLEKNVYPLNQVKLDLLMDIIRPVSTPVMIAYQYDSDLQQLQSAFGDQLAVIRGKSTSKQVMKIIDQWNRDAVSLLAVQPQALSHGVNMQRGSCRDVVWFNLPDSLLVFKQLNTRIWRQGQTNPVTIHQIVTQSTVDRQMANNLERKATAQDEFLSLLPRIGESLVETENRIAAEEREQYCLF